MVNSTNTNWLASPRRTPYPQALGTNYHIIAYARTVESDVVVLAARSIEALGLSETIILTLLKVHFHDFALYNHL